jgi:hypothetical protein
MAIICYKMAIARSSGSMNHNPMMHTSIQSNNLVNPIPLLTLACSDYSWGLNWWLDILDSLTQPGSGFQRGMFPLLWFPELSSASITSFSQQQLTTTETQQPSNSPTHSLSNQQTNSTHWTDWLTPHCPAYNISVWTAKETCHIA